MAVGEHILLGGDNMDLALAHGVARGLAAEGKQLDPWQMRALTYACRLAKEQLLSDPGLQSVPLVVPSRGSKLIGGSIRTELQRELLSTILLEGFFPAVRAAPGPSPARAPASRRSACPTRRMPPSPATWPRCWAAKWGPPRSCRASPSPRARPSCTPRPCCSTAACSSPNCWPNACSPRSTPGSPPTAPPARLLQGADMDHAVARGAAYYGQVRQGRGIRIRGGTAQAYYVGIESSMPAVPGLEPPVQALCVAPFGMEEGSEAPLPPQQLGLVVGESVRFRFFGSSVRRDDQPGTLLDFWSPEELQELAQIEATLPAEGPRRGRGRARATARARDRHRHAGTAGTSKCRGLGRRAVEGGVRRPRRVMAAAFRIGIDLGTTHTVLAFAPLGADDIQVFPIPQSIAAGEVAPQPLLPSLRFHPAEGALAAADLPLPWPSQEPAILGAFARELGQQTPGRLVASAKSWLSHPAVDRTAAILPWGRAPGGAKVSPAGGQRQLPAPPAPRLGPRPSRGSARAAAHRAHRAPASFDEGARQLTLQAAALAGLGAVHLIEEPQAAFYDWVFAHRTGLANQ